MTSDVTEWLLLRRAFRLAGFVLAAGLIGWIVWRNLPSDGMVTASAHTAEANGFIGGFTPLDRAKPVQENGAWYSDVVSEPVYFHLAAPRLYGTMRVRLRYQEEGQPLIGLGARTSLDAWQFDVKPIDAPFLEMSGWPARQDGALRVYERKPTARTAEDLLASNDRVAVFGLEGARWGLRLPPLRNERPMEAALDEKGPRRLYVYVQDGPLDVSLGLRGASGSTARVTLVRDDKAVLTRQLEGDGSVQLLLSGAKPGLYRIDLDAPETVSLIGLVSRHSRLVLIDTAGSHVYAPPGAVPFEPEFPVVTWETDLRNTPYDAVVARYQPPSVDAEGWRSAEAVFDLSAVAASRGRMQMVLSLPAVKKVGGKVRIDRVEVTYMHPRLAPKKLFEFLKARL